MDDFEEFLIDNFAETDVIITSKDDDDDSKKAKLEELNTDFAKAEVIKTLEDDDSKIEQMEKYLSNDFAKAVVISSLKNNALKIDLLKKLTFNAAKIDIIKTLPDDSSKIELLPELSDDFAKAQVIRMLKDESSKIELITELIDDFAKAEVIKKLEDTDIQIEQLEQLSNDFAKVEVIIDLKDYDIQIEQLEQLSNDFAKAEVIKNFEDDAMEIELLEKLNNDFAKAYVIGSLQIIPTKIEQMEKLNNDFAKAYVINKLRNIATKIELLENLSNDVAQALIIKLIPISRNEKVKETILNDREKLKEIFLDYNRKYSQIGLDNKITIGIEIESEGILGEIIEKVKAIATRQIDGKNRGWETKGDGSLNKGVEVVSPILTDTIEDVEDIYIICEMMQKCGQEITERCGGHIHIGADYLTSKEAYVNLFEIFGNTEKILCKISNESGSIPRMELQEYAPPISPKLNEAIENETVNLESEEDLDNFISKMQKIQGNRFSGINVLNINDPIKNTIEFRMPNGTINPDTWIENAKLFGRIVQISEKLAEIEKQEELNEEDKKLLKLKNLLKEEIPEQDKMEILLELLFSEEERTVYRERYVSNSQILDNLPEGKDPLKQTNFGIINFKKKPSEEEPTKKETPHTLKEFKEIAVHAKIGEILNEIEQLYLKEEEDLEKAKNK